MPIQTAEHDYFDQTVDLLQKAYAAASPSSALLRAQADFDACPGL